MRTAAALLALSAAAGAQTTVWTLPPGSSARGVAVDATGAIVLAGDVDGWPGVARVAPDGTPLSAFRLDTEGAEGSLGLGHPLPLPDGSIVVSYGVGPWLTRVGADGTLLWTVDTGSERVGPPALAADGTLLVGGHRAVGPEPPQGFAPRTGTWQRIGLDGALRDGARTRHSACCAAPFSDVHSGRVAAHPDGGFANGVGAYDVAVDAWLTSVVRLDAAGNPLWRWSNDPDLFPAAFSDLAWADDGRLLVLAASPTAPFEALVLGFDDPSTNAEPDPVWSLKLRGFVPSCAVAAGDGTVLLGGQTTGPGTPGAVVSVDRDGGLLWARALPGTSDVRALAADAAGGPVAIAGAFGPQLLTAIYRLPPDGGPDGHCSGATADALVLPVPIETERATTRAGRKAPLGPAPRSLALPVSAAVNLQCP